jgi:hypothetical protein
MSWTYRGDPPIVISTHAGLGPRVCKAGQPITPNDITRPPNSQRIDANGYVIDLSMELSPQWIQMLADGEVTLDG